MEGCCRLREGENDGAGNLSLNQADLIQKLKHRPNLNQSECFSYKCYIRLHAIANERK